MGTSISSISATGGDEEESATLGLGLTGSERRGVALELEDDDEEPHSYVIVTVEAKDQKCADAMVQVWRPVIESTRENPSCVVYELARDLANPLRFILLQEFTSTAVRDQHIRSEMLTKLNSDIMPFLSGQPGMGIYAPVTGSYSDTKYKTDRATAPGKRFYSVETFEGKDVHAASKVKKIMAEARLVERSRTEEDGVLYFEFVQHLDNRKRFSLVEEYVSQDAYDAHSRAQYFQDTVQKLVPYILPPAPAFYESAF